MDYVIHPFGDRAAVARLRAGDGGTEARRRLAAAAERLRLCQESWLTDIVPAYETITVLYDPDKLPLSEKTPYRYVADWLDGRLAGRLQAGIGAEDAGRLVEIPVRYGGDCGPDLAEAAERAGLSAHEYIKRHADAEYTAAMIGFMPGFPYLTGLPEELDQPRKAKPRLSVPAGSVGVAAGQSCIYPFETPGGWQLIGRTPVRLFDPERAEPSLIRAGVRIRFVPVGEAEFARMAGEQDSARNENGVSAAKAGNSPKPASDEKSDFAGTDREGGEGTETAPGTGLSGAGVGGGSEDAGCGLRVVRPGVAASVQDLGRFGYRHIGVGSSGAMDSYALQVANLLTGNGIDSAAIEFAVAGGELLAETELLIALCGAYMVPTVDGEELPMWRPVLVKRGAVIRLRGASSGCRAYLAAAGGIGVPVVMGSRSTDARAGLGGLAGRRLAAGDAVPCGAAGGAAAPSPWAAAWMAALERRRAALEAQAARPVRWAAAPWFAPPAAYAGGGGDGIELRAMPEETRLSEAAALFRERYEVAPASDRMGVRLAGPPIASGPGAELLSHGVAPGAVQLPAGGSPIVLAADCQTTGGYPVIAHVASVDMPLLAQAKPGEAIRFKPVTLEEAQRLDRERQNGLRALEAAIRCRRP